MDPIARQIVRLAKELGASPFEKALEKTIEKAIKQAKRDGATSMSMGSLMQMVRPPSQSLEGAPKGTNARYQYKEIFRSLAKGFRFVKASEKVAGKLDVKKVSKLETQVRVDGKLKYTITKYGRDNYEVSGLGPKGTVRKYANYKGALKAIEKNEGIKASEYVTADDTTAFRMLTSNKGQMAAEGDKWKKMPRGWTDESREKFWDSLVGDVKHKVTKCIKQMEGKVDDPGAFCASLADRVEGKAWRSEPRKKKSAQKFKPGDYIYQQQRDEDDSVYARVVAEQKGGGYKVVAVGGWSRGPVIKSTKGWHPEPRLVKESDVPEKFKKAIAKKYKNGSVRTARMTERQAKDILERLKNGELGRTDPEVGALVNAVVDRVSAYEQVTNRMRRSAGALVDYVRGRPESVLRDVEVGDFLLSPRRLATASRIGARHVSWKSSGGGSDTFEVEFTDGTSGLIDVAHGTSAVRVSRSGSKFRPTGIRLTAKIMRAADFISDYWDDEKLRDMYERQYEALMRKWVRRNARAIHEEIYGQPVAASAKAARYLDSIM